MIFGVRMNRFILHFEVRKGGLYWGRAEIRILLAKVIFTEINSTTITRNLYSGD